MAMNYIGSISILDRGDAPAQAVIDRNARSLAQRMSDETKDELEKVMSRVHNIYSNMDTVDEVYMGPSMEYLNDLAELEEILKDEIKKRQYQQQVTVFIVGYSDVCHQKLRLLQQVNEFFMENTKLIDEEDWFPTTPDMDLEEISNSVEDSLAHAHALTNRLGELNREMVDYVAALAEKKASSKGKKKIEKALNQAKEEVSGLSEKLLALQKDLEDKEEKVQTLFKQLDTKTMEASKFKTAAELGKQKINLLQKELDEEKKAHEETKADLTRLLEDQVQAMHASHREEVEDLKKLHEGETKALQEELSALKKELNQSQHDLVTLRIEQNTDTPSEAPRYLDLDSEASQQASRQSSKQESRPSTKDTRASTTSKTGGGARSKPGGRSPTRSKDGKSAGKSGRPDKEFAEIAIQDEGGDPASATVDEKARTPATRLGRRSKSNLAPVLESDLDSAFDLFDDQAWASVPKDEVSGRFAQFRRLSTNKLQELEDQLSLVTAKTRRKVATLKAQFQEHKGKWEAERKVLIEQVDQSIQLQGDAEKEADAAMTQLEDFITEQERLEQEEEQQRSEVMHASASLTPLSNAAMTPAQGRSAEQTPTAGTPLPHQKEGGLSPDPEGELHRLMQQTDDAKVQEMNARLGTSVAAPELPAGPPTDSVVEGSASELPAGPPTDPPVEGSAPEETATKPDAGPADGVHAEPASRDPADDKKAASPAPASEQELDSEVPEEEVKAEAQVDLSELKELPILDIADAVPPEAMMKPTSGQVLPSEATRGSSILDNLETPMAELIEGGKHVRLEDHGKVHEGQGQLMDDGSTLEKAQTHISEREATQGGSGSPSAADATLGSRDQTTVSKQATQASMTGGQKSFLGQSVTSLDGGKVEGVTEEDIRASSAQSRASLREQYKAKLEEAKLAAEDRRSKSPAINLPTQLTVDDELILDEDDDEDADYFLEDGDMPIPDDLKEGLLDYRDPSMYEIGTSPPPGMKGSRDPTRLSKDNTRISRGPPREHTGPYREPSKPGREPSQPLIQKVFRKGSSLLEHPLLREYLKTYETVVGFKDGMSKMFLDKDMMSAHQMTSDLETLTFDHGQNVMPQIEELTQNVAYVLEELVNLTNNILVYDREPPVSSLHLLSREPTQKPFQPVGDSALSFSNPVPIPPPVTVQDMARGGSQASSHRSDGGKGEVKGRLSVDASMDKAKLVELENQYTQLKQQLEDTGKQHQDQLQRNTVVMMEMQDTINELQRELSALGKSAKQSKSRLSSARGSAVHLKSPSPETSVMFTRLDSERNAKIMKKAVMDDKLNAEKYKEAVAKMDEYVSLPAQRLAHLLRKYMHHTRMRAIEEKVKTSTSVNEEVFEVLDKMENLQNRRARQWAERMDEMGIERLKLANLLMDTLDHIEQESGIFLIKPMYSYKGRDVKPGGHPGKLSRPIRTQQRIGTGNPRHATPTNDAASSFVPAPTPASNYRLVRHERHFLQQQQQQQIPVTMGEMRPSETRASKDDGQVKVMGNGMTFAAASPRTTWNMQASQPWFGKDDPANSFNTPRILELDVNRMLIGQNNITSKVPFPPSEDRLLNANNNTLRSYVTVNRPTAPLAAGDRPSSAGSTKATGQTARVSQVDKDIPEALPIPHPLPPISSVAGDDEEEEEDEGVVRAPSVAFSDEEEDEGEENTEPPHSPPGSSLYHSVVTKNDEDDDEEEEDNENREDSTLTQD